MKQKHSLQNSPHNKPSYQATIKNHHKQLFPTSNIYTILKLYAQNHTIHSTRPTQSEQNQKYYPSPNYQLNRNQPNKLIFHHYQKFDTFQFQFNRVFHHYDTNTQFSSEIDLYQTMIDENKDLCMIVMGKPDLGIQSLCQGSNAAQNQGILFGMISKLWSRINNQKHKQMTHGINDMKIHLKCLIISDQKIFDLLCPKNEVVLKDINNKVIISGCQTYQIKNSYELYAKLLQVYNQKRLLYSQCIMVVQTELIISKQSHFITDQEVTHRSFTFIQWQKNSTTQPSQNKQNSNKSLLVLNMCIYELYKISCHNAANLGQGQLKKLWSNFRNSYITMLIKYYFMGSNKLYFVSCASLKDNQEQQNYQILMVAKNLAKIHFNKSTLAQIRFAHKFKPQKSQFLNNKMKTVSTEDEKLSNPSHLQKLKSNLKRILKQKQQLQGIKQKKEEMISLFKQQKQKKIQLQTIRYKQQEIKVIQDFNKINSKSRIIHNPKSSNEHINLPTLQMKKRSNPFQQVQINQLQQQRQSTLKQINRIHEKIISNVQQESSEQLAKKALQMQIKLHQKQMIEYINNKNKIVSLLKRQIHSMKTEPNQQQKTKHFTRQRRAQSRVQSPFQTLQHQQHQQQQIHKHYQGIDEQKQIKEKDKTIFRMQNIKKLNKNNYLFEKRRIVLKNKIAKGRQQVNKFYDQAAKKFQQYHSK